MELGKNKTLFYDLCRLCLEEPGTDSIHEHTQLPRDIFLNNLPGKICKNCFNIIKISVEFRELVTKNDTNLKALFGEVKNENRDETLCNLNSNGVKNLNLSKNRQNNNHVTPVNLNKGNRENCTTEKQTKLTMNEINCQEKVKIKKIKKCEAEVIQYRCGDCCKNFETWKKLYLHARLHKKSLACPNDTCGKKFATKGDLEKHVRTHTGEKPFKCAHCHKSFAQKGSLKSHIETVHSSKSSKDR